jgi:amino acid adenylation domain-containing protein
LTEKKIEAIYPLSPMQQGMLFHTLLDTSSPAYFQQLRCRLKGRLDVESFRRAWQMILERHAALRSVFVWESGEQPLQVVLEQTPLPLDELDWRDLAPDEQQRRLEHLLLEDRRRGFVLNEPPLMRLALVRLADDLYQFVWSHHHLLLDGWSTGCVLSEFQDAYKALNRGRQPALPPVQPHRDYVAWLKRQDMCAAEDFWRDNLKGFAAPTPLAVDRKPRAEACADSSPERFREVRKNLSPELRGRLAGLARGHQLTLNDLMVGAWALLLHNYSGEPEVLFGVTVSGRPAELPGVESMVGLYINTLPLRVRVEGGERLLAWLRGLQQSQLEIRGFEYCPLTKIQEWSEVPRDSPLFESILVFENYPLAPSAVTGIGDISLSDADLYERSNYALTLIVEMQDEGLLLRLFYDSRRFDEAAAGRLLNHLTNVLKEFGGARAGDAAGLDISALRLRDITLLCPAERRQILAEWNDTARDYERQATLPELFERRAAEFPERVAVVDDREALTYARVNEEANRLAHFLKSLGLGPGDFVAVYMSRSVAVVPALLGILKSGAAYVPLESTYPDARLEHIVACLDIACVLTERAHLQTFARLATPSLRHVVCLDAASDVESAAELPAPLRLWGRDGLAAAPPTDPPRDFGSNHIAYVIFTSGSTGAPKGVVVRHRPVVNLIEWVNRRFAVGPKDRVLFITSLCFDLSVYDIFGLLAAGGSIRVVGEPDIQDPERLLALLRREPVTFWDSAPAALHQLSPYLAPDAAPHSTLRLVFLSGDWVPLNLPKQLQDCFRGVEVIALGGATEATVWSNFFPVGETDPGWSSVPYGRPIQNAAYYVLDSRLQPCPPGVPGDLYIGGECLATGYAAMPETTAERFIPNPFGGEAGGRLYRTGDRARFYDDGNIEFLGRSDRQVKIRGFRIEPGEIESVLARHEGVRAAQVVVSKDSTGVQRLVAYVVARDPAATTDGVLRSHLREHLPPYMIPAAICLLDAMPLTPNGKVDLRALPAPELSHDSDDADDDLARDEAEELIRAIWAEVLGRVQVGVNENFFDLGGHSLMATQVVSRLRSAFGLDLPLRAIFEAPTVAGLAAAVRTLRSERAGLREPPLAPVPRREAMELSFSQSRLWFLQRVQPRSPFYNVPLAVRLEGRFDFEVFSRCVREIVRRHEVLRTTYGLGERGPVQRISEDADVPLSVIDLSALPLDEREAAAHRQLEAESRRSFDLARDPLLRVTLWRLGEDRSVLLLLTHHIVSDGWSMGVLVRELGELYSAFSSGSGSPLAELPIQYADYAAWERDWMRGEVLERHAEYWRRQLARAPLLRLPTDRPRPAEQSFRGRTLRFTLSDELTADLRALARREEVTLFTVLLAAFSTLLGWRAGQEDVVVGTDVANRGRAEVEGLIGFFVNQLVLRCDLSGNPTVRELLRRLRNVTLDGYTYQQFPFEKLVQLVNPERGGGRMPLFQTKIVLQNAPEPVIELEGLRLHPLVIDTGTAKYDLLLTLDDACPLSGRLEYSEDLFEAQTVEQFIVQYRRLLEQIVLNTKLPLQKLVSVLAETEREHTSRSERELRLQGLRKLRDIRRTGRPA